MHEFDVAFEGIKRFRVLRGFLQIRITPKMVLEMCIFVATGKNYLLLFNILFHIPLRFLFIRKEF